MNRNWAREFCNDCSYHCTEFQGKFLLANVHPDIEFPVPVTSKVTYFGGLGMSNDSKPLEEVNMIAWFNLRICFCCLAVLLSSIPATAFFGIGMILLSAGVSPKYEQKPVLTLKFHLQPYASFVETAKTVVFVSFGTVADPKMMPASWKSAFVELFEWV